MIYFDNASTTFPKAPGVSDFVKQFIDESCFNISRGTYSGAWEVSQLVFDTRELIAELFNCKSGKNVVFSSGVTQSLNIVIKGLLTSGECAVTTTMEHNAVLRPLKQLEKQGVETQFVRCNENGEIDLNDFEQKLKTKPKLAVVTHASNVCGTIMPIKEMGALCKQYGVIFIVDTAQTAGVVDVDMQRDNIDILCFTGHKGLLSVQGIGGCVFSDETAKLTEPLIAGGTGSFSDSVEMPALLPDKFEAGTLNLPGIAALNRSITYINETGLQNIFVKEKSLQTYFENGLSNITTVNKIGAGAKHRCAVTALDFLATDNGAAAFRLDDEFGIMTRSGLHCAPFAHKTLGTFPRGVVRVAFGHTNTEVEIDALLDALKSF